MLPDDPFLFSLILSNKKYSPQFNFLHLVYASLVIKFMYSPEHCVDFFGAQQPPEGQDLLFHEVSRSHNDKPQSVGPL